MNLGFSRRNATRPNNHHSPRPAPKRRRLAFDCLEDRRLLSVNPIGTPFTVNDTAAGMHSQTGTNRVGMDNKGDAVAAWSGQILNSSGQPTGNSSVMFKLYTHNSDGTYTAGQETTIATTNAANSVMVARAPTSGDFAVVWMTTWVNKYGNTEFHTYAEAFDGAGNSLTSNKPILVGGSTDNFANGVAMNDNGFNVLYGINNQGPYYITTNATVPTVQRYTAAGAAEGAPITANPLRVNNGYSGIAMDPNGDFVVSWQFSGGSPPKQTIDARYFTPAGAAQPHIIQVESYTHGVEGVRVGMDATGNSVFTWRDNYVNPDGSSGATDYAETVSAPNAQGVSTVGSPIVVTQSGVNGALYPAGRPAVAVEPNGNFAVSWWASDLATPTQHLSVWADTFSAAGSALEAPFEVSPVRYNYSGNNPAPLPALATDAAGDLLVVWNDLGSASNPADTGDVFGQLYSDPPPPSVVAGRSSSSAATPSGSSTAATDMVFAAYAYPEDDDTLA